MSKIVTDYQAKIDAKASPKELIDFILLHSKDLDKEKINVCVDKLLVTETNMLEIYNIKLFEPKLNIALNNYKLADLLNLNVKEEQLKKDLQEAFDNGYLLDSSEGMFYLKIDYSKLYETFGKMTKPETTDYLAIMDIETQKHFSEDAGLIIKPDDIAARVIMTEKYLANYKDSKWFDLVSKAHKMYLTSYLIGLNNTPVFDYQTHIASPEFLKSYDTSIVKYDKASELSMLLVEYQKLLKDNNNKQTDKVTKFLKEKGILG